MSNPKDGPREARVRACAKVIWAHIKSPSASGYEWSDIVTALSLVLASVSTAIGCEEDEVVRSLRACCKAVRENQERNVS